MEMDAATSDGELIVIYDDTLESACTLLTSS